MGSSRVLFEAVSEKETVFTRVLDQTFTRTLKNAHIFFKNENTPLLERVLSGF